MAAATVALLALLMSVTHCGFHVLGADVLQLGASLTPSSPSLVSNNSAFTLSFRPFSATSSYSSLYLAISFSAAPLDHPAWVANPSNPVSPSASLNLSRTTLFLTLHDPSFAQPVQISNSSSSTAVRAQLLDSGNLVLLNSSSSVVWQSFDYPTDTLLPSQRFSSASQLASQSSFDSFAPGRYFMKFDNSGSLLLTDSQYVPNPSYTQDYWIWPNAASQSPFLQLDQNGTFSFYSSPNVVNSSFISYDNGVNLANRRITLDIDGNLRMYSWDTAVSQWIRVWLAFDDVCTRVKGLCGNYGICIYKPESTCICPSGFVENRESAEMSRGCVPNAPINCSSTQYTILDGTDFPYHDYKDILQLSEADCIQMCSSDCTCLAAVYWQTGDGHCWLKSKVLNGYSLQTQHFRSFLKISDPNQPSSGIVPKPPRSYKTVVLSLIVVLGALILCFSFVTTCLMRRAASNLRYTRVRALDLETVSGSPIMFPYQVLEAATNNFSRKLGSGAFGFVYKGQLENRELVAVKRLEGISYRREKQFRAEIATISKIHHINLLHLYGFCAEGDHRLLVYEYMENGSLDLTLFDPSSDRVTLDWKTRFEICLGVARGVTYLHEECLDCILHCDIKPQNILLGKNYFPKVADFGLAHLFSRDHTLKLTTIRGTRGYLAPEWLLNLPITAKADVFSFGMVLLEVVSGRRNYLYNAESTMMKMNEKWCFPAWAYERKVEEVVDERMGPKVDYEQAEVVLKVAFNCIQADMNARPSMGKVVQMLEGTLAIPEAPPPSHLLEHAQHRQPPGTSSLASFQISRSKTNNTSFAPREKRKKVAYSSV